MSIEHNALGRQLIARYNDGERDFSHEYLVEANCAGANFSGANFSGSFLRDAVLRGVNFSRANFSGSNLRGAVLRGVNFTDAVLWDTTLETADMFGAILYGANCGRARFAWADMGGIAATGADFTSADFRWAHVHNTLGLIPRSHMGSANYMAVAWYRKARWGNPSLMLNVGCFSGTPAEMFSLFQTSREKLSDPRWQKGGRYWREYEEFVNSASFRLVPVGGGGGE